MSGVCRRTHWHASTVHAHRLLRDLYPCVLTQILSEQPGAPVRAIHADRRAGSNSITRSNSASQVAVTLRSRPAGYAEASHPVLQLRNA
jgi:hypothetical protein